MRRSTLIRLGIAWAAAAALVVCLSRGLPPDGFFTGDCGVKLVMMFVALERPTSPLDVPPPRIGGRPVPDLLGRFFVAHKNHAHAITSELFPLASAPLVGLFGLRGAYVWPALGLLALLPICYRLTDRLGRRDLGAPVAAILLLVSPMLFYALEIWEHVPAVALTAAATLLGLGGEERPCRHWGAGLMLGIAFLLRPECLWYGPALVFVRPRGFVARAGRYAGGFALVVAPLVLFNLAHFGRPFGAHIAANAGAALRDWLALRGPLAEAWLWGARSSLAVLGVGLAFTATVVAWLARTVAPRAVGVLWNVGLLGVALAAVAAAERGFARESLWGVFPAALLALFPPPGADPDWARALRRLAVIFGALVAATASTLGGAQYGPRFLLPVCVPLALLLAFNVRGLLAQPGARRATTALLLLPTLVASLAIQRGSYRGELRVTKRIHARIVDRLREEAGDTHYVLSDLWWLSQIAASEYPKRTFLLAESQGEARQAVARLAAAGAPPFLVVRSADESPLERTDDWLEGSGYRTVWTDSIPERKLSFAVARRPSDESGGR
jgi:hypothetical protein